MVSEIGLTTSVIFGELCRCYDAEFADKKGFSEYPITMIEHHSGISRKKIKRAIFKLEAYGFIKTTFGNNKEFRYKLLGDRQQLFNEFMMNFNSIRDDK